VSSIDVSVCNCVGMQQGTSRLLDDITASEFLQGYSIDGLPPRFSNFGEFKRVCMQRYEAIAYETMATEYVAFCGVTEEHLALIELHRRQLPSMRILHDARLELLIVKLMAGKPHEWAGSVFADMFKDMVRVRTGSLFHICDMRTTRFTIPGVRSKEGDSAFVPATRRQLGDLPSMVVEVGVSEALGDLRSDATFWLRFSQGQTKIVILIAVNIGTRTITIERWGHVPPVYPSHLAVAAIRPRKVQEITIDDNGIMGSPLEIPSGLVFDVLPASVNVNDFQFTAHDLQFFYDTFWSMLY
jgi:hypothetical protein